MIDRIRLKNFKSCFLRRGRHKDQRSPCFQGISRLGHLRIFLFECLKLSEKSTGLVIAFSLSFLKGLNLFQYRNRNDHIVLCKSIDSTRIRQHHIGVKNIVLNCFLIHNYLLLGWLFLFMPFIYRFQIKNQHLFNILYKMSISAYNF